MAWPDIALGAVFDNICFTIVDMVAMHNLSIVNYMGLMMY